MKFYPENPAAPVELQYFKAKSIIFQALGAASTCWTNLGGAGIFEAEDCKEIGDELLVELKKLGFDIESTIPPFNQLEPTGCMRCSGEGYMLDSNDHPLPKENRFCGQCNGTGEVYRVEQQPVPNDPELDSR